MRLTLAALALIADPALAEPVSERGYLLNCDGAWAGPEMVVGCAVGVTGFVFYVPQDGSDPAAMELLMALPPVSAVAITGDVTDMGDVTATVLVSAASVVPDDPYEATLRGLQGLWRPDGEDAPFHIEILGTEWIEYLNDEPQLAQMFLLSDSCADGTAPGGTTLVLFPQGGDPEATGCRVVESVAADAIVLRDVAGGAPVRFSRRVD